MNPLNTLVVRTLPFVPRRLVRVVASRYVAGETLEDAVRTVRALNAEGCSATLDVLGEEVTRIAETDTAVPHREEGWNLVLPSVWLDPADTAANIAWTRETHAAFAEHLVDRRWLNYLADDEGADAIRAAYGPNYDRLVEVKRKYDPENVFRQNHNIVP